MHTDTTQPRSWQNVLSCYQSPERSKSLWQLCNSLIPFCLLWYSMFVSLSFGYAFTLLLAPFAAGFLVRLFIVQHDCGHGSFFASRAANERTGMLCSLFTLTPYQYWKKRHGIHHARAGNLGHRGTGDVPTITAREYAAQSLWGRFKYRLMRHPLILLVLFPPLFFIFVYRFPNLRDPAMKKLQWSIHGTTMRTALLWGATTAIVGLEAFLLVHIPIIVIYSVAGMWLFFVQHQFEHTYWADSPSWNYTAAALQGSSYLKLPKLFQFFTGNIGFHHIHHLSPRIPNYRLEQCHNDNPLFQRAATLTLRSAFRCIFLTLWDDERKRLISFREHDRALQSQQLARSHAGRPPWEPQATSTSHCVRHRRKARKDVQKIPSVIPG